MGRRPLLPPNRCARLGAPISRLRRQLGGVGRGHCRRIVGRTCPTLRSDSPTLSPLDRAKPPPPPGPPPVSPSRALLQGRRPRMAPRAVATVLCRHGVEQTTVFAQPGGPDDPAALAAALQEAFAAFAGPSHRA